MSRIPGSLHSGTTGIHVNIDAVLTTFDTNLVR
jgi:hypothetical protein